MPAGRLHFVDAARAVAVLLMIQGHTLSVLLASEYQASEIAHAWLFVRGLTSCTFFFLAGFSFAVATTRKWEDYRVPSWNLFRRLTRYLALWVFGYAMHLPGGSFSELSQGALEQWLAFVTVDVLQLIAVSLLFLQAAVWMVRSRGGLGTVALVAAVLIVLVTPFAWKAASTPSIPLAVTAYLSGTAGSLFPLFPWGAYVFFGAAAGSWYQEKVTLSFSPSVTEKESVTFSAKRVLAYGVGMIAAGALIHAIPFSPYGNVEFWTVSPNLFLVKGGAVLIGLSAVIRITAGRSRLPGVVTALSRQSLLVYVVHLMVLYHPDFGAAAVQRAALQLGPGATAAAALVLMAAMSLLAWLAHQRRRYLSEMLAWAHAHARAAAATSSAEPARPI
jgi:uncharacterized membrane protein